MDRLWGEKTLDSAVACFGGRVHNPEGRLHKSLDRHVQHAYKVWTSRYEMNFKQELYADEVLAWCFATGMDIAERKGISPVGVINRQILSVTNHERVHEGFSRRSTNVSVKGLLEEVLA